jgi:hypothetical protein
MPHQYPEGCGLADGDGDPIGASAATAMNPVAKMLMLLWFNVRAEKGPRSRSSLRLRANDQREGTQIGSLHRRSLSRASATSAEMAEISFSPFSALAVPASPMTPIGERLES